MGGGPGAKSLSVGVPGAPGGGNGSGKPPGPGKLEPAGGKEVTGGGQDGDTTWTGPVPRGSPRTRGAVVGSSACRWWRQCWEGDRAGPQGCDHLHDVGQHHVRGAEGPAPLQCRPLRLLLDVDVGFDWDGFPAAGRVDGDLLVLRAAGGRLGGGQIVGEGVGCRAPQGWPGTSQGTDRVGTLTSGCRSGCPACTGPPPAPPAGPSYCRQGEGRQGEGRESPPPPTGRETRAGPRGTPTHLQTGHRHVPLSQLSCR